MTDESIQHELGVLSGTISALSDNITKQNITISKIFDKIDGLPETCPTGKHLEKRVNELEKRPERVVGFAATIVAIASAIWATLKAAGGH